MRRKTPTSRGCTSPTWRQTSSPALSGSLLVTLQTHKNLIAAANVVDAAMVVFAHDKRPAEDVVSLADRVGIALFTTADDTWTYAVKLVELGIR